MSETHKNTERGSDCHERLVRLCPRVTYALKHADALRAIWGEESQEITNTLIFLAKEVRRLRGDMVEILETEEQESCASFGLGRIAYDSLQFQWPNDKAQPTPVTTNNTAQNEH